MLVQDTMTEDPIWVDFEATVGEAVRKLLESQVRHLPVLREGVVIGMISDRDLRTGASAILTLLGNPATLVERMSEPVTNLMSPYLVSVTPDRDVKDVVDLMLEYRIGAVPVVDPGSNKLVGIVSHVDVLRSVRELLWG